LSAGSDSAAKVRRVKAKRICDGIRFPPQGNEWIAVRGWIRRKVNMTTPTTTPEYMLLFRGMDWDRGLSPEEIQNVMSRWIAWFDRLTEQGKARAGQPLTDKGKVISGKKGQTVLDGPFAESKETVAGYILLQVDNLDDAVEIAKECPGLDYGISVEVRLVDQDRLERVRAIGRGIGVGV